MIGLIVLFLPLFLGVGIAAWVGRRVERATRKAVHGHESLWPVFTKHLASAVGVLIGVGFLLALMFAGPLDALDGHASWRELFGYALLQIILMAVFVTPAFVLGLLLGRQKKFGETR